MSCSRLSLPCHTSLCHATPLSSLPAAMPRPSPPSLLPCHAPLHIGTATLHNRLHYYETLRKDQLAWQHLTQVLPHMTVVRFTTHGKLVHWQCQAPALPSRSLLLHNRDCTIVAMQRIVAGAQDQREMGVAGGCDQEGVVCLHVTFPRMLHLNLAPHPTIWSKDFRAVTEDDQGRQVKLPLNHNHFYNGTVLGRPRPRTPPQSFLAHHCLRRCRGLQCGGTPPR